MLLAARLQPNKQDTGAEINSNPHSASGDSHLIASPTRTNKAADPKATNGAQDLITQIGGEVASTARHKSELGGNENKFLQSLDEELGRKEVMAKQAVTDARKPIRVATDSAAMAQRPASADNKTSPRKRGLDNMAEGELARSLSTPKPRSYSTVESQAPPSDERRRYVTFCSWCSSGRFVRTKYY